MWAAMGALWLLGAVVLERTEAAWEAWQSRAGAMAVRRRLGLMLLPVGVVVLWRLNHAEAALDGSQAAFFAAALGLPVLVNRLLARPGRQLVFMPDVAPPEARRAPPRFPERLTGPIEEGLGYLACGFAALIWLVLPPVADEAAAADPDALPVVAATAPRVLLIGLDGADPAIVDEMGPERLPNLHALADRGVGGRLRSILPTHSPVIWSSAMTGRRPAEHGVLRFDVHPVRGSSQRFQRFINGTGFRWWCGLFDALDFVPVGAADRQATPVWDILGRSTGTASISFWATWPAVSLAKLLVSDLYFFSLSDTQRGLDHPQAGHVWPPDRGPGIDALRLTPADVPLATARRFADVDPEAWHAPKGESLLDRALIGLRYAISQSQSSADIGAAALADPEVRFCAVYLRAIDLVSHAALHASPLLDGPAPGSPDPELARMVGTVYEWTDAQVGQLAAAAGPDAVVIVVSDHGFLRHDTGLPHHDTAPDGIIVAAGPGVITGPGAQEGAWGSVLDVTPTLLALMGMPKAADMDGTAMAFVEASGLETIPTYETGATGRLSLTGATLDEQAAADFLEELMRLGYIPEEE